MKTINLDREWIFRRGHRDSLTALNADEGITVNLPHDGMIGTEVSPDAPARSDSGYFKGDVNCYTKYIDIPAEWNNECVGLYIDGAMMNSTVEINGARASLNHYGYAPFYTDITGLLTFGSTNRITIHTNTSIPCNSRWYTGSGLYRGVRLCHGPKVHVKTDGIFVKTKEVTDNIAFLEAEIEVVNETGLNRIARINVSINEDGDENIIYRTSRVIQINPGTEETAEMSINLENPKLWDADNPSLYRISVSVIDEGEYRTRFIASEKPTEDTSESVFGIRTITADSIRGLRINSKTVKLRGGCVHHDNGLLGSVSLYETEARKIRKLKSAGFNAIRTAHNPPSAALIEACDRIGMYVFDEAFDAWGIAKRSGDYSLFFDTDHEKDLTSFVRRDRIHPSVIIWSTGNEIPERGGLNNGYTLATKLAGIIRKLDPTRPISNGICTLWSGLDDVLAQNQSQNQNSDDAKDRDMWERVTEPFTNGLDVVGYNYMEGQYEKDHELFPERVILGSENFAKEIGHHWPYIEKLPYVIGEFTWTAWDYIGEAGIGKAIYVEPDDPQVTRGSWALMPPDGSPFPWRLANDADFDITGRMLPQGAYRSVVWSDTKTFLYSMHPDTFGCTELVTMWGFPKLAATWEYRGCENRKTELWVFSNADEVELIINGISIGRKPVSLEKPYPNSVKFVTEYVPGVVEAISYKDGVRVSSDKLITSGGPAKIRLSPEKNKMTANGHDVWYVNIDICDEDGNVVTDASINLKAKIDGPALLAGFGSANPITEDNYTDCETVSYNGHAQAIVRSGYESGKVTLTVTADGIAKDTCSVEIE